MKIKLDINGAFVEYALETGTITVNDATAEQLVVLAQCAATLREKPHLEILEKAALLGWEILGD